jgi:hypothetical protein
LLSFALHVVERDVTGDFPEVWEVRHAALARGVWCWPLSEMPKRFVCLHTQGRETLLS